MNCLKLNLIDYRILSEFNLTESFFDFEETSHFCFRPISDDFNANHADIFIILVLIRKKKVHVIIHI
jgi:hypothetical protein